MTAPEPPPRGSGSTELATYATALLLGLVLTGLSVAQALEVPDTTTLSEGTGDVAPPRHDAIESLTCFTCHSLETYRDGGGSAFPHTFHYEMLALDEDCHLCHAFTNHRLEPVRLPVCGDCH